MSTRAALHSFMELGPKARRIFTAARASKSYQQAYDIQEPLVSVCVATYNRAELLTERAIPSILNQTYRNLEVIVIGDNCSDDTARRLGSISDSRLHFTNLPRRGEYPDDPTERWVVGGLIPSNFAYLRAGGEFITQLDDDDEFHLRRIEILVETIRETRADVVYHPFEWEISQGRWIVNDAERVAWSKITAGSTLYHRWFRQIGYDPLVFRYREPGDWNRMRKFKYLNAKFVRSPHVLLKHYEERSRSDTALASASAIEC